MNEEQVRRIFREEISKIINNTYDAPIEFLQTVETTVGKKGFVKTTSSVKSTASVTQSVDEAGVSTYDVMTPPDAFFLIEGTTFNVPYYNS